jgi:hypothetical protein
VSSAFHTVITCDGGGWPGCEGQAVGEVGEAMGALRRRIGETRGWESGRLMQGRRWAAVDYCRACARRPHPGFRVVNPRRSRAERAAGVGLE